MTENENDESEEKGEGKKGSIISYVRDYIAKRIEEVVDNPDIVRIGRITLSTIFYEIRPLLLRAGIVFSKSTRRTIQNEYIKKACDEKGYKRSGLGIIAAVRAEFYFKGETHSVDVDSIAELVDYGTDVVIIEKEGVAEALAPYADKYGIALMYTRGFTVEYARELSEKTGANIVLLTDFDASGIIIALDLPFIHRIGIDFKTLEFFFGSVITEDSEKVKELEEIYEQAPPKEGEKAKREDTHLISLLKSGNQYIRHFIPDLNSRKRRRIEIDSVLKAVGNQRFWDFVIYKLEKLFPNRNYNRAIDVDKIADNIYTPELYDLQDFVTNMINDILKDSIKKTKKDLEDYKGFLQDIEKTESAIKKWFENRRDRDQVLNQLRKDVTILIQKYKTKRKKKGKGFMN